MGCLKLAYYQEESPLKVVYRADEQQQKPVQRFISVDPLASQAPGWSPYNAMWCNPILNIDPDGRWAGEYDVVVNADGRKTKTKTSDIGDKEGIDFLHYTGGKNDGKTLITDNNGSEQFMSTSDFMKGYTHRNAETNWKTIYDEWKTGTGPENSLIYGKDHQMNDDMFFSYQVNRATEDFNASGGKGKIYFPGSFGLFGYMRSSTNMTEQMVGKAGVSIYSVGDKAVIMIVDSKSISSWTWKWWDGDDANIPRVNGVGGPKSTTNQTYLFIVTKKELQNNFEKYNSLHDTDW
jgi:hypothetical protein